MLNFIENVGVFHVRVRNKSKIVKGSLGNYIKIEHHDSLATYITGQKKHLRKQGLDTTALCINESYFETNKKHFLHPKFVVSFDNIFDECWVVTSYSKTTKARIFMVPPIFDEHKAIAHINDILLEYGVHNKIPKYSIERFDNAI